MKSRVPVAPQAAKIDSRTDGASRAASFGHRNIGAARTVAFDDRATVASQATRIDTASSGRTVVSSPTTSPQRKMVAAGSAHVGPSSPRKITSPTRATVKDSALRRARAFQTTTKSGRLSFVDITGDELGDEPDLRFTTRNAQLLRLINSTARQDALRLKEEEEKQQSERSSFVKRSAGSTFRGLQNIVVNAAKKVIKVKNVISTWEQEHEEDIRRKTNFQIKKAHEMEKKVEKQTEDSWMSLFSDIVMVGESDAKCKWKAATKKIKMDEPEKKPQFKKQRTVKVTFDKKSSFQPSKFYKKAHAIIGMGGMLTSFRKAHTGEKNSNTEQREVDDSSYNDSMDEEDEYRPPTRSTQMAILEEDSDEDNFDYSYLDAPFDDDSEIVVDLHSKVVKGLQARYSVTAESAAAAAASFQKAKTEKIFKVQDSLRNARAEQAFSKQRTDDEKREHEVLYGMPHHFLFGYDHSKTGKFYSDLDSLAGRSTATPGSPHMEQQTLLLHKERKERAQRMVAYEADAARSPGMQRRTERCLCIGEIKDPSRMAPEFWTPYDHLALRPLSPEEDQELEGPSDVAEDFPEEFLCEAIALLSGDDIAKMFADLEATGGVKCPENGVALLDQLFLGIHDDKLWPLQWTICQWVLADLHSRMLNHIRDTRGLLAVKPKTDEEDRSLELSKAFRRRLAEVRKLLRRHQDRAPDEVLDLMVKAKEKEQADANVPKGGWKHCYFPYAARRPRVVRDPSLADTVAPIWPMAQVL